MRNMHFGGLARGITNVIELKHISKRFSGKDGSVEALRDVSIHVKQGDIYGIIGYSGAGKSTLIRTVNQLETPDEGTVTVNGQNLASLSRKQLLKMRRNIGMIFQQFNLLESKTVFKNIALPLLLAGNAKDEIDQRVTEVLRFVELEDKKDVYINKLSGGQKQRVGIARALVTSPSILLCDEATSALDPKTTESILKLLKRINHEMGITILLITHQMQVVQMICNKVAVMENGRIIENGSVLEVFGSPREESTREFVRTVISDEIPEPVLQVALAETKNYRVERLKFIGESVKNPVISEICKSEGLEVNILCAMVTKLQDTVMCVFTIQLIGEQTRIEDIECWIDTTDIIRERIDLF